MTEPSSEVERELSVKRDTTTSRQRVWEVLADGWTYSQWVVGNSRMRAVSPDWPAVGSTIHHSVGVWPLLLNDQTEVLESVPQELLVLLAKGRPLGKARITLRLFDLDGGGCRIEMAEVPVGMPMGWVPERVALAAAVPRNRECTWRLAALAERRVSDDDH
ncbi:SRPBCC family protein [Mycobacterium yunnanensis]|uniref:SRPBCC family protein n=1 Tax=Mycobacterium yunnanensis TaxID=368477 RepID=A0A9X2YXT0_9MYCO|nr:SRPBCC family protein [Mycobacterium yunnanensis]MCV7420393.1 SRPBCC family protein [Mycobacterium yunnanensis]